MVSSVICLKIGCKAIFNIWKEEGSNLEETSTLLDPKYRIPIEGVDIITFPAHNLHSATLNNEDKGDLRLIAVISYYILSKDPDFWKGSEMIRRKRLPDTLKKAKATESKKKGLAKQGTSSQFKVQNTYVSQVGSKTKHPNTEEPKRSTEENASQYVSVTVLDFKSRYSEQYNKKSTN